MLTPDIIQRVLACYALGEPLQISPVTCGSVNETAFVDTSQGRFVIRRNHWRFSEAMLRYRHSLMAWLRERSFPTPALVAACDGSTLVVLDRRFYEVQTFIAGASYDSARPGQLAGVGATLARYHSAIRGFPAPPQKTASRYDGHIIRALCERLIERDFMGDLSTHLAWYSERATQLQALLSAEMYSLLPTLVIHGDIQQDNLRFTEDVVAFLLDYDQASLDARAVDLADALVAFGTCPTNDVGWGVYRGPLDPQQTAQLIAAYNAITPLELAEVAVLPLLVERLWFQGELSRVCDTPEMAVDYHRAVLVQGQRLSRWMETWRKSLYARWTAAAGIIGTPAVG